MGHPHHRLRTNLALIGQKTTTTSSFSETTRAVGSRNLHARVDHPGLIHRKGAAVTPERNCQPPDWSHSSETICISMSEATSSASSEQRQAARPVGLEDEETSVHHPLLAVLTSRAVKGGSRRTRKCSSSAWRTKA